MPVICEGCGQRVPIPAGYRRNKIQCTCGVICQVPESERQEAAAQKGAAAKPSRAVEEEAERWLLDDVPASPLPSEPPVFRDPEPPPTPPILGGERGGGRRLHRSRPLSRSVSRAAAAAGWCGDRASVPIATAS